MPVTQLCKDCRYFLPPGRTSATPRCGHSKAARTGGPDLVTGEPPRSYQWWCEWMRADNAECGPDAKLWEPAGAPRAMPDKGFE